MALPTGRPSALGEQPAPTHDHGDIAEVHGVKLLIGIGRGVRSISDACNLAKSSMATDSITTALQGLVERDRTHQERDLHNWAKAQPWRQLLPGLYPFRRTRSGAGERNGILEDSVHYALLPHEVLG